MKRVTAFYSGRVQGVGFRYTTHRLAGSFSVTGTVCNLSDGRVKLVAEGNRGELTRFTEAIVETMQGKIHTADLQWTDATDEFADFQIVSS